MTILLIIVSLSISFTQELFDPYAVHTLDIQFYNPNYDQVLVDDCPTKQIDHHYV